VREGWAIMLNLVNRGLEWKMVDVRPGSTNGSRVIKYRRLRPFKTDEIKVLLLENISTVAENMLREAGYQV
jgi:hypothetical protein